MFAEKLYLKIVSNTVLKSKSKVNKVVLSYEVINHTHFITASYPFLPSFP